MPRIALKNIEAGMQLSRPVLNSAGVLLVDRGVKITQEMIAKLVNADIRYVFVVGQPEGPSFEEAISALERRFSKTGDDPHMERLRRLLREHLQELYS